MPDTSALAGFSRLTLRQFSLFVAIGAAASVGVVGSLLAAAQGQAFAEEQSPGSVDLHFDPQPDGVVAAVVPLPDGRMVISGTFTSIGGLHRPGLARLHADGSLDPAFNPPEDVAQPSGPPTVMALLPGGKLLMRFWGKGLVRLYPDGRVDPSFEAAQSWALAGGAARWEDFNGEIASKHSAVDTAAGGWADG